MWLLYAIAGAFGKSYSSFFRKKMAGNVSATTYTWLSTTILLAVIAPYVLLTHNDALKLIINEPFIVAGGAITWIFFIVLNLAALKREELSYIAPLGAFIPLFALLFAWLFLNEMPPLIGILAILLVFTGAYVANIKPQRISWHEPLTHLLVNAGARLAIIMAAFAALNTIFFKAAANAGYDSVAILYGTAIVLWIFLLYIPVTKFKELKIVMKNKLFVVVGASFASLFGNLFHILALSGTYASYAIAVRRLDLIITVLLGWRHLNESNIRNKLIGSSIMICGIVLLVLS